MTDASANLAAVVLCPRRPMWGPRRPAGSLKGQPTAEPRPAAQHPSLGVELAVTCPQGPDGTPLGPSRALGCPWPHYKPRRGGGQARCPCYQAPYGRPRPRRHRRDPPRRRERLQGPRQHTYARPAPALAHLSHAVAPRQATSSARGRHDRQERSSVIFFLRQDLVVLHEADVLRVGPEALPADVHVVFADDGLLVAADAAAPAALAEFFGVAVDEGLGAHLSSAHSRYGSRKTCGGTPGERRHLLGGVCVVACGDGVDASTAPPSRRSPRSCAVARRCVASLG